MEICIISDILSVLDRKGFEYKFTGDPNRCVKGFSSLRNYKEGTLTWVRDKKILSEVSADNIWCIVAQSGVEIEAANKITTNNSKEVFFYILKTLWGGKEPKAGIGEGTRTGQNAVIDDSAVIGRNCAISSGSVIGKGSILEDNVTLLNRIHIGEGCIIHSGCVIGKDGFGYALDRNNIPQKAEHFGGVHIGNYVEIGANTVVDRGTIDDTCIGNHTKIDSQCLVAHNCRVGEQVLIVGGALLGGSCSVGDGSYIAPGAMIKNQISIGKNSFVGMGVVVNENIGDNEALLPGRTRAVKMRDYRRFL